MLEVLGLLYGIAAFCGVKKLVTPMKRAAVITTNQMFNALDQGERGSLQCKEGFEDIVAELLSPTIK